MSIGKLILAETVNQSVTEYYFQNKANAVTMTDNNTLHTWIDSILSDTDFLFLRLVTARTNRDDLSSIMHFEL